MEASTLKQAARLGALAGRSPLLRVQSDERLVEMTRAGNQSAFETLMRRYTSRLFAFCRHMLGSKEDAEDTLQEVFTSAYNAMIADERKLNVRPWLYRIARNRCLNHLRKPTAIGQETMDDRAFGQGTSTAEKAHQRDEFLHIVVDVGELPESQRTALLLREIDDLSYEEIATTMDTTVASVKSLLVRARISLAQAAQARELTCDEVRVELGKAAEGLQKISAPVRRHVRNCDQCRQFRATLTRTNRALTAVYPIGGLVFLKKFVLAKLLFGGGGGSAAGGSAAGGAAAGSAAAGGAAVGGASAGGGLVSAGIGAVATKAVASVAAAAMVAGAAVNVHDRVASDHSRPNRVAQAPAEPGKQASRSQEAAPAASAPAATDTGTPTAQAEETTTEPAPTPEPATDAAQPETGAEPQPPPAEAQEPAAEQPPAEAPGTPSEPAGGEKPAPPPQVSEGHGSASLPSSGEHEPGTGPETPSTPPSEGTHVPGEAAGDETVPAPVVGEPGARTAVQQVRTRSLRSRTRRRGKAPQTVRYSLTGPYR